MNVGGEFHTAKGLIPGVSGLVQHVPQNGVRHPGLDMFDQILIVDRPVYFVLSKRRKRDDGHSPSRLARYLAHRRVRGRVGPQGRFEEAMRGEPDIELPHLRGSWRRIRSGPLHVPGVITADDEVLLLFSLKRRAAAALGWIVPLSASDLLPRGPVFVVNGLGVARHLKP